MKSKINFIDNSIALCFSLQTWIYILCLIRLDLEREHSPAFRSNFRQEFSEMRELLDFIPPFSFSHDAIACLKVKDID